MKKILKNFLTVFKRNKATYIALDLGTANTLVYVANQGIIFDQPSMIAYDISKEKKFLALGSDAFAMIGKTNKNILIVKPLAEGVISDLEATHDLLKQIFEKMQLLKIWKNATVLLACPSGVTQLERDGLKRLAHSMGTTNVIIEEEVKMAAIGSDINISLPNGNLVIDIGGGTTDVAVIASNGIIVSRSIKMAGNYLDDEIIKYFRSQHNITIGIKSAIELKHSISSLIENEKKKEFTVFGRDIVKGMPREITVTCDDIRPILLIAFERICEVIWEVLGLINAELAGDIINNGLTICGGGALINGIDTYFSRKFNIKVRIASDPLKCVIEGAKRIERDVKL